MWFYWVLNQNDTTKWPKKSTSEETTDCGVNNQPISALKVSKEAQGMRLRYL